MDRESVCNCILCLHSSKMQNQMYFLNFCPYPTPVIFPSPTILQGCLRKGEPCSRPLSGGAWILCRASCKQGSRFHSPVTWSRGSLPWGCECRLEGRRKQNSSEQHGHLGACSRNLLISPGPVRPNLTYVTSTQWWSESAHTNFLAWWLK